MARKPIQSYSRLARYEQCPQSYRLHYIDKKRPEPGLPLRFGKAVHEVLDRLVREHCATKVAGPLCEDRARELWSQVCRRHTLIGLPVFAEGLNLVLDFVRFEGTIDPATVLDVEQEFRIRVGDVRVWGFIDRVNRLDSNTVEIVDYKTNRLMPTREELQNHLQLGIYNLAARELYPWSKNVILTLHMLRYSQRLPTWRTPEELDAVREYVQLLADQSDTDGEYLPRLNPNCQYCEHRVNCLEYQKAVAGNLEVVTSNDNDLDSVAREREQVASLAKIYQGRQRELDKLITAKLQRQDELCAGGRVYRLGKTTRRSYPVDATVELLAERSGHDTEILRDRLLVIENRKVDRLMSSLKGKLSSAQHRMLKAELDAVAEKSHSPRIFSKAARGGSQ